MLHSVYDQPDTASVHAQFDRILDALVEKPPKVAEHLDTARADVLAFTAFPKELWRQIWSNNPQGFVVQMILRISWSNLRKGTNSAQALVHNRMIAGYLFSHFSLNSAKASSAACSEGAV